MDADFRTVDWASSSHSVLLNPRWPDDDLRLLHDMAHEVLREHAIEPSILLSSSGSTAGSWREIKLILLSKRAMLAAAASVVRRFGLNASDRLGQILPPFHVGGLSIQARAFLAGSEVVPLGGDLWNASMFCVQGARENVSVVSLVPTQIYDLVSRDCRAWSGLRAVFVGGAALPPALEKRARTLGWPLVVTYGMTETSAMVAVRTETETNLGFEPLAHVEMSVGADDWIRVRGPSLATGWARRTADGRIEWTPATDGGGWFLTDDRGHFKNGRLFVNGRNRDQIKINGENVNLAALREIFQREAEAAGLAPEAFHLTSCRDERAGHRVVLLVVESFDPEKIRAAFDSRVLPFERIRDVIAVKDIPRTDLGKVREAVVQEILNRRT